MLEIRLSVIIPSYNEEQRLPRTLKMVDEYLKKQAYKYEILVVNGGSTDRTEGVVKAAMAEVQNLRIVNIAGRGKGYAVRQGMLNTKGDYRVFMDADNSTSLNQVEKMWPQFERGCDVVIGSRDIAGAVIAVSQPWWRRRLGDIFNIIVQIVSGLWGIWDTQCGFKGFSMKAAEAIFSKAVINGWAFDVEALLLAKKFKYSIAEIPVTWINDPYSKVKLKGMITMLLEVFITRWNFLIGKYR